MLSVGFDIERATRALPGKKGGRAGLARLRPHYHFGSLILVHFTYIIYTHTPIPLTFLQFWIFFFLFLFHLSLFCFVLAVIVVFTGDEDTTMFEGGHMEYQASACSSRLYLAM